MPTRARTLVLALLSLLALSVPFSSAKSRVLTPATFQKRISKGTWLVNFYADWSPHQRKFLPTWHRLCEELEGEMEFGTVNLADFEQLYKQMHFIESYDIKMFPAVHLYEDGKWYRYIGNRAFDELVEFARSGYLNMHPETLMHPSPNAAREEYAEFDSVPTDVDEERSTPHALTDATFDEFVMNGEGAYTMLVLFTDSSKKCKACDDVYPAVKRTARVLKSKTKTLVCEVDVSESPKVSERFGVTSTPSFLMIHSGKYYTLSMPMLPRTRDLVGFAEGGFLITGEGEFCPPIELEREEEGAGGEGGEGEVLIDFDSVSADDADDEGTEGFGSDIFEEEIRKAAGEEKASDEKASSSGSATASSDDDAEQSEVLRLLLEIKDEVVEYLILLWGRIQVAFAARPVALAFVAVVSVSFGIGFATILFMTSMFVYGGVQPKARSEGPPRMRQGRRYSSIAKVRRRSTMKRSSVAIGRPLPLEAINEQSDDDASSGGDGSSVGGGSKRSSVAASPLLPPTRRRTTRRRSRDRAAASNK